MLAYVYYYFDRLNRMHVAWVCGVFMSKKSKKKNFRQYKKKRSPQIVVRRFSYQNQTKYQTKSSIVILFERVCSTFCKRLLCGLSIRFQHFAIGHFSQLFLFFAEFNWIMIGLQKQKYGHNTKWTLDLCVSTIWTKPSVSLLCY